MENENRQRIISGSQIIELFHPGESGGYSVDTINTLAKDTRKIIHAMSRNGEIYGDVVSEKGKFRLEGIAEEIINTVGGVTAGILSNPDHIRLPEFKHELTAYPRSLIDNIVHNNGIQPIIAPVCPDYGKGGDFYKTIRDGISPEAHGAINATNVLSKELQENGLTPQITILVANTETDIPEVMENIVAGEIDLYHAQCEASAEKIRSTIDDDNIDVQTFTQFLGGKFQVSQYECEDLIKCLMDQDEKYRAKMLDVANQRFQRHSQILGRPEESLELTIRYAAQYMALGNILRENFRSPMILNYPTPNRSYFNASRNIHRNLSTNENDFVIPILGSIVKR